MADDLIIYYLSLQGYIYDLKIYKQNDTMYLMGDNLLFSEWLVDQLNERNWSQSDLASASGIGRGVINKIINHVNNKSDPETCLALAKGLKVSPITVFIAAGLLPPLPDRNSEWDDFQSILMRMSPRRREDLIVMARALLDYDEKGKQ